MTKKTKKIILTSSLIAFSTLLASPIIGNQIITEKIMEKKEILNNNGIEMAFNKSKGYCTSKRKFNGRIVNFEKFSKFIINQNIKSKISKKNLLNFINENKINLNKEFNNTLFEGFLITNNLGLENIKAEITILDMPFLKRIKRNKENESLFKIFENKQLKFNLISNTNGDIKKITMHDLYIKNKVNKASIELKDILLLEKNKNQYSSKIGKIEMLVDDNKTNINFLLKNYNLNLNYTDYLNNKITQEIEELNFKINDKNKKSNIKNLSFNIKDFTMNSNSCVIKNSINIKNKYYFNKIQIKDNFKSLTLSKFKTSINFKNLNKDALIKLFAENNKNKNYEANIKKDIKTIINNGFNVNFTANVESLDSELAKVGKISIISKSKINSNKINNIKETLSYLDSNNQLIIEDKDLQTYQMFIPIQNYLNKAKKENGFIIFNYNIKNGKEVK